MTEIIPTPDDVSATLAVARAKKEPAGNEDAGASEGKEWLGSQEGQLTVDVYQTTADIVIQSTIAGVSQGDLDITIANDMVTIKGRRAREERVPEENFYYQECYWGSFSRSVILPAEVKGEEAEATLKNGILTIRLPKAEKEKLKKIPVRIA